MSNADHRHSGGQMNSAQRRFVLSEGLFAWALVAPALIFILVIVAWPLAETFRLSFTDARLGGETYIGFENYVELADDRRFHQTIIRTFYWMFLSVAFKMILGLIGATLLNAAIPGKALFRVLVMPPWVIPIAIGCIGWLWLYNGYFGLSELPTSGTNRRTNRIFGI